MNAQQAENLRILIRHMETKVSRTLNMGYYFEPCGTPACAIGEAAVCPELAHLQMGRSMLILRHSGKFVSDMNDMQRLFAVAERNAWKRNDVTPQEWAAEARKVLAENGYSMDDGFQVFMGRVLEPAQDTRRDRDVKVSA